MNTKAILLGMSLLTAMPALSQTSGGGLSADMLQRIARLQPSAAADKALFNAIAANKIDDLARNHANPGPADTYFSVGHPSRASTTSRVRAAAGCFRDSTCCGPTSPGSTATR